MGGICGNFPNFGQTVDRLTKVALGFKIVPAVQWGRSDGIEHLVRSLDGGWVWITSDGENAIVCHVFISI
jgi:hypothetical protein